MTKAIIIATLLALAGCEASRDTMRISCRDLENETYQGPCFARDAFKRSAEAAELR